MGWGAIWYAGFNVYAARRARKDGVEFRVEKVPDFEKEEGEHGELVQVHETVFLTWVAAEYARPRVGVGMGMEMDQRSERGSF